MTYEEILKNAEKEKRSHQHETMEVVRFRNFAVMKNNDLEVIVDLDIAESVKGRRWCEDSSGYVVARVNGTSVRLHDYVMAKTIGEKPKGHYVDHINQDKHDNRRTNLRIVTPSENSMNVSLRRNNKTGFVGVCRLKNGAYRAYITLNGKQVSLGWHNTLEEAVNARREAETRCGFKTRPGTIKQKCSCLMRWERKDTPSEIMTPPQGETDEKEK